LTVSRSLLFAENGLILMELQIPVMDGYEATAKIRALPGQKYKDLPIIVLTASSVLNRKGENTSCKYEGFDQQAFCS
jgi:CheY-like chemotaxis protein